MRICENEAHVIKFRLITRFLTILWCEKSEHHLCQDDSLAPRELFRCLFVRLNLVMVIVGCTYEYMVDPCHTGPTAQADPKPKTLQECLDLCKVNSNCKGINYKPDDST